jgi:branched-chain amino acid transport system permease protein
MIFKKTTYTHWVAWLGLITLLIVVPIFLPQYTRYVMTEVLIWGLLALGFDIIFGCTGLLNFGMSSFFGFGSYGFMLSIVKLGWGFWPSFFMGILISMIFALIIGLVVTRFKSHYFVVFTIIISMIIFYLAMTLRSFTGADEGYTILSAPPISLGVLTLKLVHPLAKYYVILVFVGVSFFVVRKIFQAPLGRAIMAIRDNEERAKMLGYNTTFLKLVSFTLSGTVGGLAGSLYVILNGSTSAEVFFWVISGKAVLWAVVGGVGTLWGPFVGALVLVFGEDLLSTWLVKVYPMLVGLILITVILVAPKGIVGYFQTRWQAKEG